MSAASTISLIPQLASALEELNQHQTRQSLLHIARFIVLSAIALIVTATAGLCFDDEQSRYLAEHPAPLAENVGAAVEIDGRPILVIYASIGGFTPQERAEAIQDRIVAVGSDKGIAVEAIHTENRGSWTEILAGKNRIMAITEADAIEASRVRSELAAEYTEIVRQVVIQYRSDHTVRHLLFGVMYTILATGGFLLFIVRLFWLRKRLRKRLEAKLSHTEPGMPNQVFGGRLGRYLGQPLLAISRVAIWIILLAMLQAYGTVVLRFFPATKYTSYQVTNWLFSALAGFGKNVIAYAPNLILLAFICLITFYLIKVNEYFFGELRDEKLRIRGFYSDWAEPTAKLTKALILVASVIVAFPYLPGSQSPAFKGISVFLGVLLSLGSTSAVAHGVSGTILTYMRAFQVGDFVRIGNDVGEVIEKTLLVTRMCTQKNEVITIPNGTVLGGVVVNYSAEARKRGVIFHTLVTIGYNAPWRQVHQLLLSAALSTEGVLQDPPPFVLQTALNDFYVSYELNAYTVKPRDMQNIYSILHQNIQDTFNEAGVEINSPHYASLRDGNETTIPHSYVPKEYKHPVFEVREVNVSASSAAGHQERENSDVVHDPEVVQK